MRLHIGELAAEQLGHPLDGQPLGDVDELAAAVIALARQAFGIFVGEHGALRFQHRARDDVLRGDQFDLVALAAEFEPDRLGDLGIALAQTGGKQRLNVIGRHGLGSRRHHGLLAPAGPGPNKGSNPGWTRAIPYRPQAAKHWEGVAMWAQYIAFIGRPTFMPSCPALSRP